MTPLRPAVKKRKRRDRKAGRDDPEGDGDRGGDSKGNRDVL